MFALVPAWRAPTVTTPKSPGAISRATRVWRRVTIAAASTTGSTPRCGIEPCDPAPCTITRIDTEELSTGPGATATFPAAGEVSTCWPRHTSGAGTLSIRPSSTIERAPAAISSPGWNRAM